jgi:hypothetical protein
VAENSYQSTYRRSEMAMPALLGILALIIVLATVIVRVPVDGNTIVAFLPFVAGAIIIAIVFVGMAAFRVHRWTIEPGGIRIEERPKVPLTGFRRSANLSFQEIAALRRVQSGFDFQLEIATRDGKLFRLAQVQRPGTRGGLNLPDPESLEKFASSIRSAAVAAGSELPATAEGLSFWNGPVGILLLAVMFIVSLAVAAAALWGLWEGMRVRPRMGEAEAIAILLPFGAAYLLFKSLKRRRAVLSGKTPGPATVR